MSRFMNTLLVAAAASLVLSGVTGVARAESGGSSPPIEASLMGGIQVLNQNDTAVPDRFLNVPLVASVAYRLTSMWAVEGEFTWMIPVKQSVDVGSGAKQDMKSSDVLAYQVGARASFPLTTWTPYLAAGLGAATFLSNTDADRVPQLSKSQTAFAINFGGGASYGVAAHWGLRADVRELVAFPSNDAQGLSSGGNADPIWMERATLGIDYRF
jgi:opacity protein-like surface antigen